MTGHSGLVFQNALQRLWLAKAAHVERVGRRLSMRILPSATGEEGKLYGIASMASVIDHQGEVIPPAELEKAAHGYMARLCAGTGVLKLNHRESADATLLESSIGYDHGALVWRITVRLDAEELRTLAREGKINGFSIGGTARPQQSEDGRTYLYDWDVEEISIVTEGFAPVNPAAQAVIYKAKETGMKPLGEIREALDKALRIITRESEYTSTSQGKDTTTEEMRDATVEQAAPDATVKADAVVTVIETHVAPLLEPVVKAIAALNEKVDRIATKAAPSAAVPRELARVEPVRKSKYPYFAKAMVERAVAQGLMRFGDTMTASIAKAVINTSGWTYGLHVQEARAFTDTIVDESALLKIVRVVQMDGKKMNVDAIGLGSRVFRKGTPGTDPGDTVSLSGPTQIQLSAEEIIAIVSIGDDTAEFSNEGDGVINHIVQMVARAGANEIEAGIIHGDTTVADASGINDRWDGVLKQAIAGGHVLEGMTAADRYWAGSLGLKGSQLLRSLPTKFRRDVRKLVCLVHPDAYQNYEDDLAGLGSTEAFRAVIGGGPEALTIRRVPHVLVPLIKTNISFTHSSTPYTDGTVAIMTDPKNIIWGVNRNIRIEPWRNARTRATEFVVTMHGDIKVETADAIAVYNHLKVRP